MLGTLKGALEVRQVKVSPEDVSAEVEGVNEVVDKVPVLTGIRIHYRLQVPGGSREAVDRALSRHQDRCPTAQTLKDSVAVSWTADIRET